jgi:hypothetical protein
VKRAAVVAILALGGCGGSSPPPDRAVQVDLPPRGCKPARVRYGPNPGPLPVTDGLPWVAGGPRASGLIALFWFWPPEWLERRVPRARIYARGAGPKGLNMKVMWTFADAASRHRAGAEISIRGRRFGGRGRYSETFPAVGSGGPDDAQSYATIIDLPRPGCWRLTATTGSLDGWVDIRAVR